MLTLLMTTAWAASDCAPLDPILTALDGEQACASVLLGALNERARELGLEDCLELELAHRGLPVPPRAGHALPVPPPLPNKATRDPYSLFNAVESENFVVRWDDGVTAQAAEEVLEAFEDGWRVQIDELGYPVPPYADAYKINVYVGDSGPNAPQLYSAPAYQTNDREGVPMIVMSDYLISRSGANTAVHEFQHAVQAASRYSYTGAGAWYFEATASWIEVEVYPYDMAYASSVFGYAYLPYRSLDYFKYATSDIWEIDSYHQYGALVWLRFLTENYVDATFIRDTWVEADSRNNPIETTRDLLEEQHGLDLDEVFVDFAGHNAVWDYLDHDAYVANIEARQDDYIDESVTRRLTSPMSDWSTAVSSLPERFGSNYILLKSFPGDDLHVQFDGDAVGDAGNAAEWHVQVVIPRGRIGEYHSVEVTDGAADAWVEGVFSDSPEEVWVAITALSEVREPREAFGYRYFFETDAVPEEEEDEEVEMIPNNPPDDEEPGGRCATGGGDAGGGLLLASMALIGLIRRRRAAL